MRGRDDDRGLLIPFVQVVTDILAIECSLLLSWWVRFHSPLTTIIPVTRGIPPLEIYLLGSAVVTVVLLSILGSYRMYGVRRNASRVDEMTGIARSVTTGMILIAAGAFFYREYSFSRLVFVYMWISGTVLLSLTRIMILEFEKSRHRRGMGLVRAAIVGSGIIGADLYRKMHGHAGLGIEIAGYAGEASIPGTGMTRLGNIDDIPRIIEKERLGALFLALSEDESPRLVDILNSCTGLHVEFYLVPDMMKLVTSRLRVEEFE
ncbi:MAG TPA: hypothetical protein VLA34_01585, partial [Candidatus Krumholzibacterium sp.]|nr:hypothetical protein [Candidatus Krumholzibacterium sp.]